MTLIPEWSKIGTGVAGQVLKSNGPDSQPSFQDRGGISEGALIFYANEDSPIVNNWEICEGQIESQSSSLFEKLSLIPTSISFEALTSGVSSHIGAITYGDGKFLLGGAGGFLRTSTDKGDSWQAQTSGTTSTINALIYSEDDEIFVMGTDSGGIRTSTDAITWTNRTSGTLNNIHCLLYAEGLYIAAGASGVLRTSTDAITWTTRTSGGTQAINDLVYGKGIYMMGGVGGTIRTSTDGITWNAQNTPTSAIIFSLGFGRDRFIYGGDGGVMATSKDGSYWTVRTSGTSSSITRIIYEDKLFTYVGRPAGSGGALATSINGSEWIRRTIVPSGSSLFDIAYGDDTYIYCGANGALGRMILEKSYNTATEFSLPNIIPKRNFYSGLPFSNNGYLLK